MKGEQANPLVKTIRAVSSVPRNAELAVGTVLPDCPGDETLVALVERTLDTGRVAALADHVDRCERCRATVGALAGSDDPATATSTRVGRYELRDQLGAGGMGVVWRAWDPMLERMVAIKLVRPEVGEHGSARMLREARAAAKLAHPNVVAVYDVGEHAGAVFIATELVEGEPLDRWQLEKSASAIVDVYVQACRGLAAAHSIGLVHRDVKASNILVGHDGRVRVGDFGLARGSSTAGDAAVDVLTHTGHVVGTPAYMAPEQRAAMPVDARADQFSLCVALAEALGGVRPRPETPAADLRVEPRYADAIARGLRLDPDERWPDLDAFVAALLAEPTTPTTSHRSRRWIIVGTVVVTAAVAAIVVGMRGPADPAGRGAERGSGDEQVVIATTGGSGAGEFHTGSGGDHGQAATGSADPRRSVDPGEGSGRNDPDRSDGGGRRAHRTGARSLGASGTAGGSAGSSGSGPTTPTVPPNPGSNAPGPAANPAWNHYVDAMKYVSGRDARCRASFATFDAAHGVLPPAITPHTDTLARARCELLAGNCKVGAARITALYTADGLSKPTIAEEVDRETRMLCPATSGNGTWQERLSRLETQAGSLTHGSLSELSAALANAIAIVRDAGGRSAMSDRERIQLSTSVLWIATGFARLDGHCGDARRARALSDYDPMSPTDALNVCLTTTNP